MSLEAWNTAAAVGTFIVIAASAIAALVQLHHLRVGNKLQALLTVMQMRYEPLIQSSFDFITGDFPRLMEDEAFRRGLERVPADRTVHKELLVCDYFERLGSCIKLGLIDADVYLDGSSPETYWNALEPAIRIMRRLRGPSVYENFEFLVALARRWDEEHPAGTFPKGVARLIPVDKMQPPLRREENPGPYASHTRI